MSIKSKMRAIDNAVKIINRAIANAEMRIETSADDYAIASAKKSIRKYKMLIAILRDKRANIASRIGLA